MSTFLETVIAEYTLMRSRAFAGDYTGVTHAGIAIVALDTGRVFLAKRAYDETDAEDVRETWEFPGGGLRDGEEPYPAAVRETIEETGWGLPDDATVDGGWRSDDGVYQGFRVTTAKEFPVDSWTVTTEVSDIGWFDRSAVESLDEVGALRPEVRDQTDWDMIFGSVSGNEEDTMTEDAMAASAQAEAVDPVEMDDEFSDIYADPIPIHGVLAPEEVPTGDRRGFAAGSMTRRPLRLPFRWQESDTGQHNGAAVVGSVDRLMRKDGLIHYEGSLMPSARASDFAGLMEFFDGRYGVSVDGDNGSLDQSRSKAEDMMWFDSVRASGLTAVDIPAFPEAYVSFGPHPDMPEVDDEQYAVMTASGDLIGGSIEEFKRGPGWLTNPRATNRIHDYWTKPGQPGYEKVGWGTPGSFRRARALIGEKIAKNSPEKMRFINQIIAQWYHDATGKWPGTAQQRAIHAKHSAEPLAIKADEEGLGWEAVLTSSAGVRALPPSSYFDRHPDTGALVIEEPDEFGLRRTYGYAGERGVCHIGYDGRCVEIPIDEAGTYSEFHLGRTKTADEGYINTGVVTYKVDHRDAQTILSESAEQQHFDNIAHAWAAVRLGTDDNGVWFSGVVLPGIPEEDITLIEATGQVSIEAKYGAIRALQAVNVPGFPVMRSSAAYDDEGNVVALVASAHGLGECEPTPAERMEALARADAEARFETMKEQFNWTDVAEELVAEAEEEGRVEPVGVRDDGAIVYEKDGEVPGTDTIVAPMPAESGGES